VADLFLDALDGWAGVDLRTVQRWMGYTDMESTMHLENPTPASPESPC
jgi:hypothetical protein